MYFVVQIIFEGVAGTGFYGSDVAIDDIHVYVTTLANCTFLPAIANPTPKVTPTSGKSRRHKLQPMTALHSSHKTIINW